MSMNANFSKLKPGQKVIYRLQLGDPSFYEYAMFEVAEVCQGDRGCYYVKTKCDRLLPLEEIQLAEDKPKRGQHPNSKANLQKGPQSRKKTRVRKLFSLSPETVEWLQNQPIPASQVIDELVAIARSSE
ncbi:hypothetical protein H6G23_10435 [Desertifilum sp. FACHB-866]|nr:MULTISPECIES: hypothetical protein [Desertifilum]MBD2322098.1 hypothetical protein [Desertifilum sp. FACHB-866]MBD2333823.1 hypothetical protein [Desertifilum sp. FACHB-868]